MKKNWAVAIGREFMSGGSEVARKLSERMQVPYYDKDLIAQAAERTNLSRETVVAQEEKTPPGYRRNDPYGGLYGDDPSLVLPVHTRIYTAQCDIIRHLAGEGASVFVGRCADYVLDECSGVIEVISVFIRADFEKRVKRCMRMYSISDNEARKLIQKTDKIRSKYYNSHTNREWGAIGNYTLIVDTGVFGTDGAAAMIEAAVNELKARDKIEL